MPITYHKELHTAKQAALHAGDVILKYYGKSLTVTNKSPTQPVTQADLEANQVIRDIILTTFPNDGWLSEEDVENTDRFTKNRIWIIDPLDGTKDFINQNPEFAVSIALIENDNPIVGVVLNPVTKELFFACKGMGAFCNEKKIHVRPFSKNQKPSLLVSQSEYNRGEWTEFENDFDINPTGGCAYKMGKVARGDADGTFTLAPKSEWDICAGHLIIEEAGGSISYLDGEQITYNKPSTIMDGLIYSSCQSFHKALLKIVNRKI